MNERPRRRLYLLESRRQAEYGICPGHLPTHEARMVDYRAGLRAFSPDHAQRAAYDREQGALEALPPCERCGWKPFVVRVRAADHWGQHDPAS